MTRTDLGNEIHPKAIAGAHPEPGAVQADALLLYHHPLIGFDLVEAGVPGRPRGALAAAPRAVHRPPLRQARGGLRRRAARRRNPTAQVWQLAAAVPFAAFLCTATQKNATIDKSSGLQVTGLPGIAPNGYADFSYRRALSTRAHRDREPAVKVDVCIVGSGFGGSISAFRLAELYRAAGQEPSILVLERGQRHLHTDFRQSMDIELLARIYGLVQGLGAQIVLGDGVGGSSNLYLAASLRSPSETFERRDHRPDDGPDRRMWPARSPAPRSTPTTRGRSRRCACSARPGTRWRSRAGCGRRRSRRPGTPATACRRRST